MNKLDMCKLTKVQRKMVDEAIGDGTSWPEHTDDPEVNCAVDVLICGGELWHLLEEGVREAYRREVAMWPRRPA